MVSNALLLNANLALDNVELGKPWLTHKQQIGIVTSFKTCSNFPFEVDSHDRGDLGNELRKRGGNQEVAEDLPRCPGPARFPPVHGRQDLPAEPFAESGAAEYLRFQVEVGPDSK